MTGANISSLIGTTTRYIAGRNAMQTVYWRSSSGPNSRMLKINKTCEFDKAQKLPYSIRVKYYNQNFRSMHRSAQQSE